MIKMKISSQFESFSNVFIDERMIGVNMEFWT